MAQAPATVLQEINGLYVATYALAATQAGIQYWETFVSSIDSSVTLANAATTPISTADAKALGVAFETTQSSYFLSQYPTSISDVQFVGDLYLNIGGGVITNAAAVQYWLNLLLAAEAANGGNVTAARAGIFGQFVHDTISNDLSTGAASWGLSQSDWQTVVSGQQALLNKMAVSQYWALATATPQGHFMDYGSGSAQTNSAFITAMHAIGAVSSDPATVAIAEQAIQAAIAAQALAPINALPLANYNITDNLVNHATTEGTSITFTLHAPAVGDFTPESWTLTGATGQVIGPTSGTLVVSHESATLTVNTLANVLSGGDTTLTLTVTGTSQTGVATATDVITIHNASQTITSPSSVNEGSSIDFTVHTNGISGALVAGQTESYTLVPVNPTVPPTALSQVPAVDRSGTITLDQNGAAVITVHTLATVFNSASAPTFDVVLSGGVTSGIVTINEVATLNVTDDTGQQNSGVYTDGNSITFHIKVGGVPGGAVAGTTETWTLTGSDAATLNQVVGSTSGTITLDNSGQATVTVLTKPSNSPNLFAGGTLTLSIDGIPSLGSNLSADSVTINPSTFQQFGPLPRGAQTVVGGPNDTTFQTVVDIGLLGPATDNTYVLGDTALGNPNAINTWQFLVESTLGIFGNQVQPRGENINILDVTNNDLSSIIVPTTFDLQFLDPTLPASLPTTPLTTITSDGSHHNLTFLNLQNLLSTLNILNNQLAGGINISVQEVDRLATVPGFTGAPLELNVLNNGVAFVAVETLNDTSTVSDLTMHNLGGFNDITFDGTALMSSLKLTDTNSGDTTIFRAVDDTEALTVVDTTGIHTGNTVSVFGIEASDGMSLKINEGPGNNTFGVTVEQGATLNIDSSNGNNTAYIKTFDSNQSIFVTEGNGSDFTDIDRVNGASNYELITLKYGNSGNDTINVDTGWGSTVNVLTTEEGGGNTITINGWNASSTGTHSTVTVGDGNNTINIDTWSQNSADEYSFATIVAGTGSNTINVTAGWELTTNILTHDTSGHGNNIDVETQDAIANITVGDGNNNITFNDNNPPRQVADRSPGRSGHRPLRS